MINHLFDDNASIKVCKFPSNLVSVPKVNERYEVSSFFGDCPQYNNNLQTMKLVSNSSNNDPVSNMNPTFYGACN